MFYGTNSKSNDGKMPPDGPQEVLKRMLNTPPPKNKEKKEKKPAK